MNSNVQNLKTYLFKTHSHNYSRISHKTILLDQKIFVFGGVNFHNDFNTSILSIDCQNYQVTQLNTKNSLPIQAFSLFKYQNQIYFWGGRKPNNTSNQLWRFKDNLFVKIQQNGEIPTPRQQHSSIMFAEQYLIIYGGLNDKEVFNDWYALDLQLMTWCKIQANLKLPLNNQPKMVWLLTRGVLLISQVYNEKSIQIESCFKLYEFKLRKINHKLTVLVEEMIVNFLIPFKYRNAPSICKYNRNNSLSLAIIGGQRFDLETKNSQQLVSDTWLLNLETLQCNKIQSINLSTKYGSEAVFYRDRILLIGGVISINQLATNLEVIDLNFKQISIDRKLCNTCQIIYGLKDYGKEKISIKVQYQSQPSSFIPSKLIEKFSQFIQNPIKAFGLFLDNAINLNASKIEITVRTVILDSNIYHNPEKQFLQLTDNSFGFNKQQILQSFFTFGYKFQTFTHDIKFEEQLAIRKEYGLNLKLGSIRLGKACLFITTTIQDEKFIGYFSTNSNESPNSTSNNFNCFYYFINTNGECSSLTNKHIIEKNVDKFIDLTQLEKVSEMKTKIFIFDFNKRDQFRFNEDRSDLVCEDFEDQGQIFMSLIKYLKYLYLKPFIGRTIKFCGRQIQQDSIIQCLKDDQNSNKISKINLEQFEEETKNFQYISLYKRKKSKEYENECVLIYSSNRLIQSFIFEKEEICGVIELKIDVQIGVGKCWIQNVLEKKRIKKYILKLVKYAEELQDRKKRQLQFSKMALQLSNLGKPIKKIK